MPFIAVKLATIIRPGMTLPMRGHTEYIFAAGDARGVDLALVTL